MRIYSIHLELTVHQLFYGDEGKGFTISGGQPGVECIVNASPVPCSQL
jgi:hypothetical protein